MSYTSSLTDKEWEIVEPLLPKKRRTRPPKWNKREILNGILYQLKNGCNWVDLPKDLPPYSTVFWHYKRTMRSIEVASSDALGANALREQRERLKTLWFNFTIK